MEGESSLLENIDQQQHTIDEVRGAKLLDSVEKCENVGVTSHGLNMHNNV